MLSIPRHVLVLSAGLLAALASTLLASGQARAAAKLTGLGGSVSEASHRIDIRVHGLIAEVDTHQTVIARGGASAEAVYTFDLPSNAAVTGLDVTLAGGRTTSATIVDASLDEAPAAPGAHPDVALVRLVEIDGFTSTYELRVFPVPSGRSVSWTLHWVAPLSARDGRLVLRIPPRGRADNLVAERVSVRGSPPRGTRGWRHVVGSGRDLGTRLPASFAGSLGTGVVVELVPGTRSGTGAGAPAVLEVASVPLPDHRSAVAYSLLSTAGGADDGSVPSQVVLVVDVSRSMGERGRRAAATLAQALLSDAPADAEVGAVLFDRKVRLVGDALKANQPGRRAAIARAIEAAPLANGSDFAGAMARVDALLARGRGDARVILITDGLAPLDQTPAALRSLIGQPTLSRTRFSQITLVPDGAPVPPRTYLPGAGLIEPGRSAAVTLRQGEVAERRGRLWRELWSPPALQQLVFTHDEDLLANQPLALPAGSGVVAAGLFRGPAPRQFAVAGVVAGSDVTVRARRRPDSGWVLPLALADMQSPPSGFDDLTLLDLATRAHVVTRDSALLAIYPGDAFGKARLDLAARFGPRQIRRLPPPVERGESYRSYHYEAPRPDDTAPPVASTPRPTGTLDRQTVEHLMLTYVVPRVRGCYQHALLPARRLHGSLTIVVELARGEVQSARIDGSLRGSSTWAARVEACALDAAYGIQVPTVRLGDELEAVSRVTYPLVFRVRGSQVEAGKDEHEPGSRDPLEGL